MVFEGQNFQYGATVLISPVTAVGVALHLLITRKNNCVDINFENTEVNIIKVYGPQQGRPVNEKEELYNMLQEVYKSKA